MPGDKIPRRGGDGGAPGFRVWAEEGERQEDFGDVGIYVREEDADGNFVAVVRHVDATDAAALGGELVAAAVRALVMSPEKKRK